MIQSLIQTSIAQIGTNGTCAAFGAAGIVGGLILYPTIVKTIQLAGDLFRYIKKSLEEKKIGTKIKSFFFNNQYENIENFLKGEKIVTITKETIFIPVKNPVKDVVDPVEKKNNDTIQVLPPPPSYVGI